MTPCPRCGRAAEEGASFCAGCGVRLTAAAPATPRARKTVTVVFVDVSGFTSLGERLDPESLEQVMLRYFAAMRGVVERHGGAVEKFIGDGVMAVFGVPVVHEDDAVRAARAALEMRAAIEDLNEEFVHGWDVHLRVHTGVNTGEVVVGQSADGQAHTLGDAVNTAQRLESAAAPGEILVGPATARLLRGVAGLEPVKPLRLKGKAAPVDAWRLLAMGAERHRAAPRAGELVGRAAELGILSEAFAQVVATRQPRLVTVVGPAGIGKSRLAQALAEDVAERATVLTGRCLPYGEGITYWPVVEIVRRLTGVPDEAAIAALAGDGAEARRIARRVARVIGVAPGGVAVDEAHWAIRRLLEIRAARHPVIVVFDDLHWAEPTLLELVDHIWRLAAEVPLLGVALARPELEERHPSWRRHGRDHAVLELGPLAAEEGAALLDRIARGAEIADDERERVLTRAEGNPLFLEQIVAARSEHGAVTAETPPTIHALLAARIDGLPAPERAAIGAAAVEGRNFHRGAVADLVAQGERDGVDAALDALVERQLIRPAGAELLGETGYRFSHGLIRDVAYALLPKARRADLHERYATWLKARAGTGYAELVGYHLEQAHRWHAEVRPRAGAERRAVALDAAEHLGAAGRAAMGRGDVHAAAHLLERAVAVLPGDDPARGRLVPELGTALVALGQLPAAEQLLLAAARDAAARGEATVEAHAWTARFFAHVQIDSEAAAADLLERFDGLRDVFEEVGDDLGLARLWRARALVYWLAGRCTAAEASWTRAVRHGRRAGDDHSTCDALVWLASSAREGPFPVEQALARCGAILDQLQSDRRSQALVLRPMASLEAMAGRFDAARAHLDESAALLADLGVSMHSALCEDAAFVALAADDPEAAEAMLRASYAHLEKMGERALLSTNAAVLARALYAQGRDDEALTYLDAGQAAAAEDDLAAQIMCRAVRAQVLARRGDIEIARHLASIAVELARRTDWLRDQADTLMAYAEVIRADGDPAGAAAAAREALELYERKGHVVGARRARDMLARAIAA